MPVFPQLIMFSSFLSLKEPATQPAPLETDQPAGVPASVSDVPKAAEPGRLEQLRPQELLRVQEPAPSSGEKARLSEAPGGKKSLSMLHYLRGAAPKDIPVPLSHSINGKSKPWEPFMAEEFAHQFHESVLQSTQKALQKHKGNRLHVPCRMLVLGVTGHFHTSSTSQTLMPVKHLEVSLGMGVGEGSLNLFQACNRT